MGQKKKGGSMKSAALWVFLVCGMTFVGLCHADVIKVRDKGFIDGQIVSESDNEIQFKDDQGQMRTFLRKDILNILRVDETKKKNFLDPYLKNVPHTWTDLRAAYMRLMVQGEDAFVRFCKGKPLRKRTMPEMKM